MSFSEQQTGQDLHTFFDVWLYGTGFPEFNLRSEEGVQTRSISLIK
ncbi:MAG: hypothetical protein ACOC2C_05500 [Cyclonatronaceae bacterium]